MARTPTSLAGSAAAAAKKVLGRRSTEPAEKGSTAAAAEPTATAAAKKTAAKKTAAKKSPAKKAAATRTAAKKSPVTKAPAKTPAKTPAEKRAATSPAKDVQANRAAATKTPRKTSAPAKKPVGATKTAATSSAPTPKVASVNTAPVNAGPVKKAPGKRVTPGTLVVLEGESAWTKAELKEVTDDLHDHKARLTTLLDDAERELAGLMRDAGDGAGHDQADMGATSFERDHELTVVNNEREMLAQTDRALARIDDGTYGVCEACEEPIGKMRLMAFPRATLCLSCKQREERR